MGIFFKGKDRFGIPENDNGETVVLLHGLFTGNADTVLSYMIIRRLRRNFRRWGKDLPRSSMRKDSTPPRKFILLPTAWAVCCSVPQ